MDTTIDVANRYIMVPAPDEILIELFKIDKRQLPSQLLDNFDKDGEGL